MNFVAAKFPSIVLLALAETLQLAPLHISDASISLARETFCIMYTFIKYDIISKLYLYSCIRYVLDTACFFSIANLTKN